MMDCKIREKGRGVPRPFFVPELQIQKIRPRKKLTLDI
jgi:hypothetical protein